MSTTDLEQVLSQEEVDTLLDPNDNNTSTEQKNAVESTNPYDFSKHTKTTLTDFARVETANELFVREISVKPKFHSWNKSCSSHYKLPMMAII